MSTVKKLTISALCLALCCVLPTAFHALGLGAAFSPIHLPVLLCGMVCGPVYGALCGVLGPILSCLLTSMPGAAMLPSMVPELLAYGLFTGLFMMFIRTGRTAADLYLSLLPAMLLGRVVGGIAKALFLLGSPDGYSISLWASAFLVQTLPGAILDLIAIPVLILALTRANLLPARYGADAQR